MGDFTGSSTTTSNYSSGYIPETVLIVDESVTEDRLGIGVWPINLDDNESSVFLTREQVEQLVEHLNDILADWD